MFVVVTVVMPVVMPVVMIVVAIFRWPVAAGIARDLSGINLPDGTRLVATVHRKVVHMLVRLLILPLVPMRMFAVATLGIIGSATAFSSRATEAG